MKSYTIKIKDKASLIGAACAKFELKWNKNPSADIECNYEDGTIKVQVPDSGECFSGFAICYDKTGCETTWIPIEVCPCTDDSQCSNCSYCGPAGECISDCDKLCVDETCIECDENNPCEGNQECKNFKCQCPAETPAIHPVTKLCVECIPGTIRDCQICNLDGEYENIDCDSVIGGVCDPDATDPEDPCVECLKTGDCKDPNAICTDKQCRCKPGFIKDENGICVVAGECDVDADCGDCEFCNSNNTCEELIVADGRECTDCDNADDCDDGYGCLGGKCVLCSSLSCDYECGLAQGCGCPDGVDCEDIGDRCGADQVSWVKNCTGGSPGITTDGCSALIGTHSVETVGISYAAQTSVTGHSSIMDHKFTYEVKEAVGSTCAATGSWFYSPQYGTEIQVSTASGNTLEINLTDSPINRNSFGFYMIYKSTDGREVTFKTLFKQSSLSTTEGFVGNTRGLQAENQWNTTVSKSTGKATNTSGATPLVCEFCLSNSDFEVADYTPITYSNETIDQNPTPLQVSFSAGSNSRCVKLNYTGCGQWEGALKAKCLGNEVEVPFDPIFVDEACCIINEGCSSVGEGCDEVEVLDISDFIVAYPYYGGDNGYSLQVLTQENSGTSPVTFDDMWRLGGAVSQCWTKSGNLSNGEGIQGNSTNEENSDIYLETTIDPSQVFEGNTVEFCFGKDCNAKIDSCTEISGCRSIDPCQTDGVLLTLVNDFNGFPAGTVINSKVFTGVAIGETVRVQAMYSVPSATFPWIYEWEQTPGSGLTLSNQTAIPIYYGSNNFHVSQIDVTINSINSVEEVRVTVTNTLCGNDSNDDTIDPNEQSES